MTLPLRTLLTGFEPFGGSPLNPSQLLVGALARTGVPGLELHAAVLPVVGGIGPGSAWAVLAQALNELKPRAVVCFGEAHTRGHVSLERVALNLRDYRIADNTGAKVEDEPVVAGASTAHFATLPLHTMRSAAIAAGVPCELSLSAGAFLCNEIMFRVLEHSRADRALEWAGFVHLPQLPEQHALRPAAAAPMSLADMERGAAGMLTALADATTKTTAGRRTP